MANILFVEDNEEYKTYIEQVLVDGGHTVDAVVTPIEALEIFQANKYDLVLADYMFESMNGIQLVKYLKKLDNKIKTIILTGVESPDVELSALDNSINQFLHKGVTSEVLLKYIARVMEAQVEQPEPTKMEYIQSVKERIVVDLSNFEVLKDGVPVTLAYKEFQILVYFLRNMGRVLTREELIENVWETQKGVTTTRVVDTHVKLLRKKLNIKIIQTIRNVGYRWNE